MNERIYEKDGDILLKPKEEIVRCKDCKHNHNTCFNHGVNEPICEFTDIKMKETDFCSFGERRAEQ